jgi:hypothetical protein
MRGITSVVAAALALGAALAVAPAAHANFGGLPLTGFGAIVVDQAHKHLFVTGGSGDNSVVVTDFSGNVVKQVTGEFGADGLALSGDGSTVYAALSAGDAVSAISTTTLAETARYSTPAQTCPATLARTGQFLWVGYGCGSQFTGGIARLDTAAATPTVTLGQQGEAVFQGAPLLAAANAGPVVATQPDLSLATTDVYSVNNGSLQPGVSGTIAGSNVADIAVTPDGAVLYSTAGSEDHVAGVATSDFAGRGAYTTGHFPDAVAVSADGGFVATGIFSAAHKVLVFAAGATTPVRTVTLSNSVTAARGLAWSADGKKLFVVTQAVSGGSPSLVVVDNPTTPCTILC